MIGKTEISVKATLDAEGNVTARAVGRCTYGNRTSSVDTEITDEKALGAIGSALKKAVTDDVAEDLDQRATSDAYRGLVVATDKGEKVK